MEALVVTLFTLAIIIVLEASYWLALSLANWIPALAFGGLTFWLTNGQGVAPQHGLALAIVSTLLSRRMLRRS